MSESLFQFVLILLFFLSFFNFRSELLSLSQTTNQESIFIPFINLPSNLVDNLEIILVGDIHQEILKRLLKLDLYVEKSNFFH